jgi:hypothetical protein
MKRILALILVGVLVGSMTTSAFAQGAGPRPGGQQGGAGGPGGGQRMGMRIDITAIHNRVVATLGLTAAQKTAVAAADKKNKAAVEKMRAANKGKDFSKMTDADRKKLRDASQKQNAAYQAELKKAMGAKYATYDTKMKAEIQKEMAKMGGMAAGRGMQMMETVHKRVIAGLGLTAQQKTAVAAADKKYKDGMTALIKKNQGVDRSKMTDAQRKAQQTSYTKLTTDHEAALKKAMGAKYATYQSKMKTEMEKEMAKMGGGGGTGRPGTPPKPGGRGA